MTPDSPLTNVEFLPDGTAIIDGDTRVTDPTTVEILMLVREVAKLTERVSFLESHVGIAVDDDVDDDTSEYVDDDTPEDDDLDAALTSIDGQEDDDQESDDYHDLSSQDDDTDLTNPLDSDEDAL